MSLKYKKLSIFCKYKYPLPVYNYIRSDEDYLFLQPNDNDYKVDIARFSFVSCKKRCIYEFIPFLKVNDFHI